MKGSNFNANDQVEVIAPDGTVRSDDSPDYKGTVSNFGVYDTFDFADISFAANPTVGYSGDSSGGTLTVSDGSTTAKIALLGNYMSSTFVASSDGHGGTYVVDPPALSQPALVTQPHS